MRCTPTHYPYVVVTFGLAVEFIKELGGVSTHETWVALTNLYDAHDFVTKMHFKDKLSTIKIKEGINIIKLIHSFQDLLDQLSSIDAPMFNEEIVIL
jgi:hypothetical protein